MEWISIDIGHVCNATHTRDPGHKPEEKFCYIDISGIDRDRKEIVSASTLFGHQAPSRARKVVQTDDVLVSTVRPNLNAVALVPKQLDGQIASTGFCVLRANQQALDARYLFYYTQHPGFVAQLTAHVRGANYPAVTDGTVKTATIPLPSLSEQRRIVEILDQADALRKKRAEADKLADRILPALFYKMFGDPATNPKGWDVKTLAEISAAGPQYGANASSVDWVEGQPRYIRITDVRDDGTLNADVRGVDLDDWGAYRLQEGDLLFARSGATVGKTYLCQPSDGLCVYAGYMIRFHLDTVQVEPEFVFAFTQSALYQGWVEATRRTGGQPNINGREYAALSLPVPDRTLQQTFGDRARELRKQRVARQRSEEQLESLFSTLLHRSFSGDLTAKWREAHMKELLLEMKLQAKDLELPTRSQVPVNESRRSSTLKQTDFRKAMR